MRQQLSNFKAEFFKALAHPLRISILDALRDGELTVNEISQRFSVEPPNASQQLAVLRNKNIIVARKEGANVYYSVRTPLFSSCWTLPGTFSTTISSGYAAC